MNRKLAPCSVTKLKFTNEEDRAQSSWIHFPELTAPMMFDYKSALQDLQRTILEDEPNNLKEIGDCFKELERCFDKFEKLMLKLQTIKSLKSKTHLKLIS